MTELINKLQFNNALKLIEHDEIVLGLSKE